MILHRIHLFLHWLQKYCTTLSQSKSSNLVTDKILRFLLITNFSYLTAEWKPISGVVCAKGNRKKPAVFTPLLQGTATKLKLVYKSGFIRCDNNDKHNSHWGCYGHNTLKHDGLNMVITDSQNSILLPTKFDYKDGKWYKMPGYNSRSPNLVLPSDVGMYICKGCPLKVWYGEDLVDFTTEDNNGKVCFQVYAFMLPEPDKPSCVVPKGKIHLTGYFTSVII